MPTPPGRTTRRGYDGDGRGEHLSRSSSGLAAPSGATERARDGVPQYAPDETALGEPDSALGLCGGPVWSVARMPRGLGEKSPGLVNPPRGSTGLPPRLRGVRDGVSAPSVPLSEAPDDAGTGLPGSDLD